MPKQRKTKKISYNLHDRGRKHTGINRSNVDMSAMINLLNSPSVQEMVVAGQMYGYFGHEIRARYGMIPPDAVPIDGKMVPLVPACRTLELKVDRDGNVTHRQEFLDTEPGEYAREQYLAKVGGFSTAINYRPQLNGGLTPVSAFGFDYVTQPNYLGNSADGALFDGLFMTEQQDGLVSCFDSATDLSQLSQQEAMIANLLERQVLQQFDNISSQLALIQLNQQNTAQLKAFDRQQQKQQLQQQRQNELITGMIGEVRSFDSVVSDAERYMQEMHTKQQVKQDQPATPLPNGLIKTVRKLISF